MPAAAEVDDMLVVMRAYYNRTTFCKCKDYYEWSAEQNECVRMPTCSHPHYGDHVCLNEGVCVQRPEPDEYVDFYCRCPPAWSGLMCDKPYDPCQGNHLCGKHRCERNPRDRKYGYRCLCWPGFTETVGLPGCEDIDECQVKAPCEDSETCVNLVAEWDNVRNVMGPGYRCDCPHHECAVGSTTWSAWSQWTPCSTNCGFGERTRQRTCKARDQACTGEGVQLDICTGKYVSCDQISHDESGKVVYQSGRAILHSWGWTSFDLDVLDDATFWNEDETIMPTKLENEGNKGLSRVEIMLMRLFDFFSNTHLHDIALHHHVSSMLLVVVPMFLLALILNIIYYFAARFTSAIQM